MANVRIESDAFSDTRIETLGMIADYNRFEALGRLAHLWRTCTILEAYILTDSRIKTCLGDKGPEALIESELGERVEAGIYIKGTKGRIEWIQKLRANASAGGKATKVRRLAKHLAPQTLHQSSSNGAASGAASGAPMVQHLGCQTSSNTPPKPRPSSSSSSSSLPSEEAVSPPSALAAKKHGKKPRTTPDTPHHNAIAIFMSAWEAKYGTRYLFVGTTDGTAVSAMLEAIDSDTERFRAIVALYLADDEQFLSRKKHPITLLRSGFNKYSAVSQSKPTEPTIKSPAASVTNPQRAPSRSQLQRGTP